MYKKILLLCLCLFLAACSNAPDPASSLLLDSQFDTEEFLPDFDFRNAFGKWRDMCESEDAYYFTVTGNTYLHYFDKKTESYGVLCGKPECSHSGIDCNAYLAGGGNLMFYDGYVYWVQQGTLLYRMRPDGTERELVQSLRGGISNSVWLHRGYVYAVQAVSRVVEGENQSLIRLTQAILGDTDQEPKQILEVPGVDYFYQVVGNTVYLGVEQYVMESDSNTEHSSLMSLYAYDGDLGTLTTLAETLVPDHMDVRDMRYLDETLYLSARNDTDGALLQYNPSTSSIDLIQDMEIAMPLHVGVEYVFGITGRDDVRFCIKDFQGNLLREGQIIIDPTISKEVWGIVPKLLASDRILVLLVDSRPNGQPSTIYEIPLDPAKPIRTLISIERKLS